MAEHISFIPQQPLILDATASVQPKAVEYSGRPFEAILDERIQADQSVRFSGHAQDRMKSRNIQFNASQMDRITGAVNKAANKGAKDALLLVDNVAALVSVENRTVITVVDEGSLKDNVFTNIDSAVVA